ncbi:hypothetical protein [Moraxella oblonga]|uniref:hypothetical protein n=1 Tax=Moraxella oblonga TaxID=200413 RepID=UPI00082C51C6|nr:hypothetical protein [Moraxella oblonga]
MAYSPAIKQKALAYYDKYKNIDLVVEAKALKTIKSPLKKTTAHKEQNSNKVKDYQDNLKYFAKHARLQAGLYKKWLRSYLSKFESVWQGLMGVLGLSEYITLFLS